jgi:hypothetical protein
MKSEWEKVEIGNKLYTFEMLQPELAIKLSLRFAEAFGGIIASFIPVLGADSEELDIFNIDWSALNLAEVQGAMMSACAQMDAKKIYRIFDAIMPTCFVVDKSNREDKGHRCTYDDFNGQIKTLYKVLFFALRYNFSDFFVESPRSGE